MRKFNQAGFAALTGLLGLVIIGLIIGTGWYVWNSQKETDKTLQESNNAVSSTTPTTTKSATKTDSFDGWTPYTTPGGQFSVNLPNGWQLHRYQSNPSLYAFTAEELKINKSVKAVVAQEEYGKDGSAIGYFLNYAEALPSDNPLGDVVVRGKTTAGDSVIGYKYVEKSGQDGIGGLPKDATSYVYVIQHNGRSVVVSYGVAKGGEDIHTVVEESIQSLKFL